MIDKRTQARIRTHPEGVTILLVMLVLSIVTSVALAVTFLIIRQFEQGADVRKAVRAQNVAESGVERILYETQSARSGSPTTFVESLRTDYGCDTGAGLGDVVDGTFCTDETASFEYENQLHTALPENEMVSVDLYDPNNPSGTEVTAVEFAGAGDPNAWLEVSWVGWTVKDGSFEYIPSNTKAYFQASELSGPKYVYLKKTDPDINATDADPSIYFINDPDVDSGINVGQCVGDPLEPVGCLCTTVNTGAFPQCEEDTTVNYIMRVRAIFGDVSDLQVTAYANCVASDTTCTGKTLVPIPARVGVKVIGENSGALQAIRLSIPWRFSLASLYDYAILAQDTIYKDISVSPGFYSSGTVQAEQGISLATYSANAYPNLYPDAPFQCDLDGADPTWPNCTGWNAENINGGANSSTVNARCQREPGLDASEDATCGFEDENGQITYSLAGMDLGKDGPTGKIRDAYYINFRARVTSEDVNEAMAISRCNDADLCETPNPSAFIDEAVNGAPSPTRVEWINRANDGWLTCTFRMSLIDTDSLRFEANPNPAERSPRLDWFNVSTISFNGQDGCEFSSWTPDTDSISLEVEDFLPGAGETCQGGYATAPNGCDLKANFRSQNYIGTAGSSASDPVIYCGVDWNIGPPADINHKTTDPMSCLIRSFTFISGYAIPLMDGLSSYIDVPEGNYYVILSHREINDISRMAVRSVNARTPLGMTYSGYATYLNQQLNAPPTGYTTTVHNFATSYPAAGMTGYGPVAVTQCYLPVRQRVHSGDSIVSTVSNGGWLNIDKIELSRDIPAGVPACP